MSIGERLCDCFVDIRSELIGNQGIPFGGQEMQLVAKVFPLLRGHLCGLRRVRRGRNLMNSGVMHVPQEEW